MLKTLQMRESRELPIYIYGEDILRKPCKDVSSVYPIKNLVEDMIHTLKLTKTGTGLAAPQIGISMRIFIVGIRKSARGEMEFKAFINPEILQLKGARKTDEEGCLSIPKVFARVERSQKIKVKYLDVDFNEHTETFKGFDARIIQHEFDHLCGILFIDNLQKQEHDKIKYKVQEIKKEMPKVDYKIEYVISPVECPECHSTDVLDFENKYKCGQCGHIWREYSNNPLI